MEFQVSLKVGKKACKAFMTLDYFLMVRFGSRQSNCQIDDFFPKGRRYHFLLTAMLKHETEIGGAGIPTQVMNSFLKLFLVINTQYKKYTSIF